MADVVILAIETATGCGSVSLTRGGVQDGRVLAEFTLQPEITHSRRLLGSVEAMMKATGTAWQDLDAVAVSLGPGSFTGLRIGMAAAKGIAMAADIPLLGVPTLDALAGQVTVCDQLLCCLLDARKQQIYAAFYRTDVVGNHQRVSDFLVLSPDELLRRISEPTLVAGPGIQACQSQLANHPQVRLLPLGLLHPRAALVGFCGARLWENGGCEKDVDVMPLYVRASEAELNLRSMKKNKGS
jgi:tRNA threonylcarbamoyladenosine biosynthesis protein TsaB